MAVLHAGGCRGDDVMPDDAMFGRRGLVQMAAETVDRAGGVRDDRLDGRARRCDWIHVTGGIMAGLAWPRGAGPARDSVVEVSDRGPG